MGFNSFAGLWPGTSVPGSFSPTLISFDFETFSEVDLREAGMHVYAAHPSTEVLCVTAIERGGSFRHTWHSGRQNGAFVNWFLTTAKARDTCEGVIVPRYLFYGWNVGFEFLILRDTLGLPGLHIEQFRDTAAIARSCSLPGDLEGACAALHLPEEVSKLAEGKHLVRKLTRPRKPSKHNPATRWTPETAPEDFARFYVYNDRDVVAEMAVLDALPVKRLRDVEEALWRLDFRMNDRGLPFDVPAIHGAADVLSGYTAKLDAEASELTSGIVESGTDVEGVKAYACSQGVDVSAGLDARLLEDLIRAPHLPVDVRRLFEIRQEVGLASVRKLGKMLAGLDLDDRARGLFLFLGAIATGRWAGRRVQPHNFVRNVLEDAPEILELLASGVDFEAFALIHDNPFQAFSRSMRGLVKAPPGSVLYVADYKTIEFRVCLLLAGHYEILERLRAGEDLYVWMAARLFGVPLDEVTDAQRFLGKTITLGCIYQMGGDRLFAEANKGGADISLDFAHEGVSIFRETYALIRKLWRKLEACAREAIKNPGQRYTYREIAFFCREGFLWVRLPTGSLLAYPEPQLDDRTVSYMGIDSRTRQWVRVDTYGGKWCENITQRYARDLMAGGMLECERQGFDLVGTVHDEVIAEVPLSEDSPARWQTYTNSLCILPPCAKDLPLEVEGARTLRWRKV